VLEDPTLRKYPRPPAPKVSPPEIHSVVMTTNDLGFNAKIHLDYDNPTPLAVNLGGMSIGMHLFETPVLRIGVRDIDLKRRKGKMEPSLEVQVLTSEYAKIGELLNAAMAEYLKSGSFPLKFVGPLEVLTSGGQRALDWVKKITSPLGVVIPNALMQKVTTKQSVPSPGPSMFSTYMEGMKVKTSLIMDQEKITIPLEVELPQLVTLPELKLDYEISASIHSEEVRLLKVTVQPLSLTKLDNGGNKISTTIVLTPSSEEKAALTLAQVVEKLLYSSDSNSKLSVKEVAVSTHGKSTKECGWCSEIFSKFDFPVPLPSVPLKEKLFSMLSKPKHESQEKPFQLNEFKVEQDAVQPAINLNGELELTKSLPMIEKVIIPFMKLDLQVDNDTMVTLSLPNGVLISKDSPKVKIGAQLLFSNGESQQVKMNKLVSRFAGKSTDDFQLGVTGLTLGVKENPFKLLQKVNLHLTTNEVMELKESATSAPSPGLALPNGMIKPTDLEIAMLSKSTITASMGLQYLNPFPVSISIGSIAFSGLLNGDTLISVTIPPIAIQKSGSHTLNLKGITLQLGESEKLQDAIAHLVRNVMEKKPISGEVGVSGITLGPVVSESKASGIRTFSKIIITKDLATLQSSGQGVSGGPLDMSTLLPSPLQIPKPKLLSGSVKTQQGAALGVSISLGISNPLPISIKLPFISFAAGLGDAEAVRVSIQGLDLKRGESQMSLVIGLQFSNKDDIQNQVASLVSRFLRNQDLSGTVFVTRVLLGKSEQESTKLISRVTISKSISELAGSLKNVQGSSGLLSGEGMLKELKNVALATTGGNRVQVSLSAILGLHLPISVDIGFVGVNIRVSGAPLVDVSLNGLKLSGGSENILNLVLNLDFHDEALTQQAVSKLVNEILHTDDWKSTVGGSALTFGVSGEDSIRTFSKAALDVPIRSFISPEIIRSKIESIRSSPAKITSPSSTSITSLVREILVETLAGDHIHIRAAISKSIPVSLDIGFVAATLYLNKVSAVELRVGGIHTSPKNEVLEIDLNLHIRDGPELEKLISSIIGDIMNGSPHLNYDVGVGAITFGKDKPIQSFSLVQAHVPLTALGVSGASILGSLEGKANRNSPVKLGGVKDVSLATKPGDRMEASALLNIQTAFRLTVKIPLIKIGARIDDVSLVSIHTGISLSPDSQDTRIVVSLLFSDTQQGEALASQLVDKFLNGKIQDSSNRLIVHGLEMGISAKDTISALSKVEIAVPVAKLAQGISFDGVHGPNSKLPVSAKDVKVYAKSGGLLEVSLAAHLNIAVPISLDIGFVSVTLGLNRNAIVSAAISNIQISPQTKDLSMKLFLQFHKSEVLARDLNQLTQALLKRLNGGVLELQGVASVGGILIGVSREDNISLLSKVFVDLPLKQIADKLPASPGNHGSMLEGISNVHIATLPGDVLRTDVSLKLQLPFEVDVSIPHIGFGLSLDDSPLVNVGINGLRILPQRKTVVSLSVITKFNDSEQSQNIVSDLFKSIFVSNEPVKAIVFVNDFGFGLSPQDRIETFKSVRIGAPVAALMKLSSGNKMQLPGGNALAGISNVALNALPENRVSASFAVKLGLQLPLSINVGYIEATVGLNGHQLATVSLSDIKASPETKEFKVNILARFHANTELSGSLNNLVGAILKNEEAKGSVTVSGIRFGALPNDNIELLSRAQIAVPIGELLKKAKQGDPHKGLPMPKISGINDVKLELAPHDEIRSYFAVGLEMPFQATINVPFLSVGLGIDGISLARIIVTGLKVQPTQKQELALSIFIQVIDNEQSQAKVAQLVQSLIGGNRPTNGQLLVNDVRFGVSEKDYVSTFQGVQLPIPLPEVLKNAPKSFPSLGGNVNNGLPFDAKNVMVNVGQDSMVDIALEAHMRNLTIPAEISMGYFSTTIGLNDHDLVTLSVHGLKLSPKSKDFALRVFMKFHNSEAIEQDLAKLVEAAFKKVEVTGSILIREFAFGVSKDDHIDLLHKAKIAIGLSHFAPQIATLPVKLRSIVDGMGHSKDSVATLKAIDLNLRPNDILEVQTKLQLAVQFPISVSLGFLRVSAMIVATPFFSLQLNGIRVTPETKALDLHLSLKVYDSESLEAGITKLTEEIIKGNLNHQLGVTGFSLGNSQEDRINAFSKVVLHLPIEPILRNLLNTTPTLPSHQSKEASIVSSLNLKLSELKVATLPRRIVVVSAKAGFSNPLPIKVDVGFVSVGLGVNGERIANVRIKGLKLSPGENTCGLDVSIEFAQGNADLVGAVLMDVMSGNLKDHRGTFFGFAIGSSEEDHITALRRARLDVPVVRLTSKEQIQNARNALPAMLSGKQGSPGFSLTDLKFNTETPGLFMFAFSAELASTVMNIDVGYLAISVGLDPSPANFNRMIGVQLHNFKMGKGKVVGKVFVSPQDSESNARNVARIVNSILGGSELPEMHLFAGGLSVGSDEKDRSDILSKIPVSLPLKALIQKPITLPSSPQGALPTPKITDVAVHFINKYTIRVGAKLAMTNSFPISGVLGFAGLDVAISGRALASVYLDRKLMISGGENMLDASITIVLNRDPKTEDDIASLIQRFVHGDLKSIDVGVTGVKIGSSMQQHTTLFSLIEVKRTIGLGSDKPTPPALPAVQLGKILAAVTHSGIGAQVPIQLPFAMTLQGIQDFKVDVLAKGVTMVQIGVGGLAMQNTNQLNLQINANVNAAVTAPFANSTYEIMKLGQPVTGLGVGNIMLTLTNGDQVSLLSKLGMELPPKVMHDPALLIKLKGVTGMNCKAMLSVPIDLELDAGFAAFDVYTVRGKVGEVRQPLTIRKGDGFVVFIKSTVPLWNLVELGKILANMQKENKILRDWNFADAKGAKVAWINTVFNAMNFRSIPKWGRF
jgi:hypothetical protein